jgi:glycosidase
MIWGTQQDQDILKFYKDLIALRKNHSALRRGARHTIFSNDQMLAYRRSTVEESLVIVLNISEQNANIEVDITESTLFFVTSPEVEIRLEGGRKRILLPPFGGLVLQ